MPFELLVQEVWHSRILTGLKIPSQVGAVSIAALRYSRAPIVVACRAESAEGHASNF